MSRCFPFPPPGYEKKSRPEDANILKEEEQKEKKPKKEKREREKREGKEKREKDKCDEKHREKRDRKDKHKDKKDKHREKKKDKSKEKEREKSCTSETSKVTDLPEAKSGERIYPKDKSYYSEEKNHVAKFHDPNTDKRVRRNIIPRDYEEARFVEELGRRITDEKAAINQSVDRISVAEKKRNEETQISAVGYSGVLPEDIGKSRDKRFGNKKMDVEGIIEEARFSRNSMVQSVVGTAKPQVDLVPGLVEKFDERKVDRREKSKGKDEKWGEKNKNKDRNKKGHGKDKDREKERKKEEKANEKRELKKYRPDTNKSDLVGITDEKCSYLTSYVNIDASVEGNFKKRKERDNGFLCDDDTRPKKLPPLTSHPVAENGRKLEAYQIPSLSSYEKPGIVNPKVDKMDEMKNGIIELQSLPTSKLKPMLKPLPATSESDIVEASRKPSHPDLKYLSQVLSVPKMDEWSEFDDQEWLFGSQDPPSQKPEVSSPGRGEERQVWCDALHIESADVVALPYVLPY